jgi:hypothetical protein
MVVGYTCYPDDLEKVADALLEGDLKNRKCNKARTEEYPVLSKTQLERRRRREVPFSSLHIMDKIELGIRTDE